MRQVKCFLNWGAVNWIFFANDFWDFFFCTKFLWFYNCVWGWHFLLSFSTLFTSYRYFPTSRLVLCTWRKFVFDIFSCIKNMCPKFTKRYFIHKLFWGRTIFTTNRQFTCKNNAAIYGFKRLAQRDKSAFRKYTQMTIRELVWKHNYPKAPRTIAHC